MPVETIQLLMKTNGELAAILHNSDLAALVPSLIGVLANIVGPVPEEYWRTIQLLAEKPCGTPHCNCHVLSIELFHVLDTLREDWIENVGAVQAGKFPNVLFPPQAES